MTHYRTDDVRIEQGDELLAPMQVMRELAASDRSTETTFEGRRSVHDILRGADDRLLVVVGPCSIHDYAAAVEYGQRLAAERARLRADLAIVMRVYFEKPRTTVGWKGFINDPRLDETFDMNEGIRLARKLLLELNELAAAGLAQRLMVAFSHANSSKDYRRQLEVARDVAGQLAHGERRVVGVMAESHLKPGRQDLLPGKALEYGVSITDACLGWPETVELLDVLAEAVRKRRLAADE